MPNRQAAWGILFGALCISWLNGAAIAQGVRAPQKFALLIGVNNYSELRPLDYAAVDQWALAERLRSLGFPADQIFVLSDRDRQGQPSGDVQRLPFQRNVERWLKTTVDLTKPGDTLVVAFSGHGVQVEGSSYLCPIDASPENPVRTMISVDLLNARLNASDADLKPLVLDACRDDDPRPAGRRSSGRAGLASLKRSVCATIAMSFYRTADRLRGAIQRPEGDQHPHDNMQDRPLSSMQIALTFSSRVPTPPR